MLPVFLFRPFSEKLIPNVKFATVTDTTIIFTSLIIIFLMQNVVLLSNVHMFLHIKLFNAGFWWIHNFD